MTEGSRGRSPEGRDEALLRLNRLRLPVRLGWSDEERSRNQEVLVDLVIRFAAPPIAVTTDDLSQSVNYVTLAERAAQISRRRDFRLLEGLAGALHAALRPLVPVGAALEVTVTKDPRLPGVEGGASFTLGESAGHG